MHIVRAAEQRAMPWKNGGGITYEVAIVPAGASLDDLDWRVSMARVETDGPFSRFSGIDRSLAIMEGHGLRLVVDGADAELALQSRPLVFSGDVPVVATLIGGPIIDLNVMTRRGVWRHRLAHEPLDGVRDIAAEAGTTLAIVRGGAVTADGVSLGIRDAVLLAPGERASLEGTADLFRIDLARA